MEKSVRKSGYPGPSMMRSNAQQCIIIMGNGHMPPSGEQTDWQTHATENDTFPQLRWGR